MKIQTFLCLGLWLLCACYFSGCKDGHANTQPVPQSLISSSGKAEIEEAGSIANEAVASEVYVCQSSGATKYHYKENCLALKRCKHTIVTMKEKDAANVGLGLCGYED